MKMLKCSEPCLDNSKRLMSVKYICLRIPPCTANVCRNGSCFLGLTGVCFHDTAKSSRTAYALLQECLDAQAGLRVPGTSIFMEGRPTRAQGLAIWMENTDRSPQSRQLPGSQMARHDSRSRALEQKDLKKTSFRGLLSPETCLSLPRLLKYHVWNVFSFSG